MLYHMGARNYECKMCGNKFFQMEHLKRHMQSIHNVTGLSSLNKNKTKEFDNEKATEESYLKIVPTEEKIDNIAIEPKKKITAEVFSESLTKCIYKCQKCQFNSENLYLLNEHNLNQHSNNYQNEQNISMNSFDYEDDQSEINEEIDDENENENFEFEYQNCLDKMSESIEKKLFCSFCQFSTTRKIILKV